MHLQAGKRSRLGGTGQELHEPSGPLQSPRVEQVDRHYLSRPHLPLGHLRSYRVPHSGFKILILSNCLRRR
jgi:hypothetical protein